MTEGFNQKNGVIVPTWHIWLTRLLVLCLPHLTTCEQ